MGSGNYGGSKHFSRMISFGTAEEQAKVVGGKSAVRQERKSFAQDGRTKQVEAERQQSRVS